MLKRSHLPISIASALAVASVVEHATLMPGGDPNPIALAAVFIGGAAGAITPDLDIIIPSIIPKIMVWLGTRPFKEMRKKDIRTGHRSYSHAGATWVVISLLAFIASLFFRPSLGSEITNSLVIGFSTGYFFHLVADMTTVSGIPFFWPLSGRRYFVIPSIFRFTTGKSIMEPILVFIFCAMFGGIFLLSFMYQ